MSDMAMVSPVAILTAIYLDECWQYADRHVNIRGMEPRSHSGERDKRKLFWSFSKADSGWFAFWYVLWFSMLRFDLFPKHHPWFQRPMPTNRAGWIALLVALLCWLFTKLRFAAQ
jgi:hypothetical protein